MALSLRSNFPGGNARFETQTTQGDLTELHFSAEPSGGAEALWFHFTLQPNKPPEKPLEGHKLKLVWRYFDTCWGASNPLAARPVIRTGEQDWVHLRPGRTELQPDGQIWASWDLEYPTVATHFALTFPYDKDDLAQALQKSRHYWKEDCIGLTQTARPMFRLANHYGQTPPVAAGLYLAARAFPGEQPASWVLDGFLSEWPRLKKAQAVVWVVPVVDPDGAHKGFYGRGVSTDRPEWTVLRRDLQRWQSRSQAALLLEFQAAPLDELDGVRVLFPEGDSHLEKWANVLLDGLGREYAAEQGKNPSGYRREEPLARLCQNCRLPHLIIAVPWNTAKEKLLSRKSYRDIGQHIAQIVAQRLK